MKATILLQRVLFSIAAAFWLVFGALALFDVVDFGADKRRAIPGDPDAGERC